MSISDYIKVIERPGAEKVLLAFSGNGARKGYFQYYKQFLDVPYHVILLNCDPVSSYYHFGVEASELGFEETVACLKTEVSRICVENPEVVTFGCSMGGYGALLYGAALGANLSVALSPRVPGYTPVLRQAPNIREHIARYDDMRTLLFQSKGKKILYFGDRTLFDHIGFVEYSELKNSDLVIFHDTCHELVEPLSRLESLRSVIKTLESGRSIDGFFSSLYFDRELRSPVIYGLMEFVDRKGFSAGEFENFVRDNRSVIDLSYTYLAVVADCYFWLGDREAGSRFLFESLNQCISFYAVKILVRNISVFKADVLFSFLESLKSHLLENPRMGRAEILGLCRSAIDIFRYCGCLRDSIEYIESVVPDKSGKFLVVLRDLSMELRLPIRSERYSRRLYERDPSESNKVKLIKALRVSSQEKLKEAEKLEKTSV